MEDSSSRCIMCLVPVFILETHNQTNNKCLPKFVQTDNASSNIKTANNLFRKPSPRIHCAVGLARPLFTTFLQSLDRFRQIPTGIPESFRTFPSDQKRPETSKSCDVRFRHDDASSCRPLGCRERVEYGARESGTVICEHCRKCSAPLYFFCRRTFS